MEIFHRFFNSGLALNASVALWKLPNLPTVHSALSSESIIQKSEQIDIHRGNSGFIIGSFASNFGEVKLIQRDIFIDTDNNLKADFERNNIPKEHFYNEFESYFFSENSKVQPSLSFFLKREDVPHHFKEIVSKAKVSIAENVFKKVVLSRQKYIETTQPVNVIDKFFELCNKYPSAFVSVIYEKNLGVWMGASPELLVSISKDNFFRTIALAGTQRIENTQTMDGIVWRQKEIEEQALVARYIINCFKALRLREYEDIGPRTVRAGNIAHLQTDFEVNLNIVDVPNLGNLMLNLLHPTSAVCGMPRESALEFIIQNEGYNRRIYTGFLGPINTQNESSIFVNLRCASIFENGFELYAGAGITADSDPEKEFEETEAKMETIGNILASKTF